MKLILKNSTLTFAESSVYEYGNSLFTETNKNLYNESQSGITACIKKAKNSGVKAVRVVIEVNADIAYFKAYDSSQNELTSYALSGYVGNSAVVPMTFILGDDVAYYSVLTRTSSIANASITEYKEMPTDIDYDNTLFVSAKLADGTSQSTVRSAYMRPIIGCKGITLTTQLGSTNITFREYDASGNAISGRDIMGGSSSATTTNNITFSSNAKYYTAVNSQSALTNADLVEHFQ